MSSPGASEAFILLFSCLCMLLSAGAIVGFIVWLVRRSNAPTPSAPAPAAPTGALHLSVLAVGIDAQVRARVAQTLTQPYPAPNATQLRVMLLQRVASTLTSVQPAWRYFGYGEKDLADLASAEQSYRANVEDFRVRSAVPPEPLGTVAVLTVVVALRGPPGSLSRLDDPQQLRALLEGLARVDASQLLGAEVLWAPQEGALTEASVGQRFPEMQRLNG